MASKSKRTTEDDVLMPETVSSSLVFPTETHLRRFGFEKRAGRRHEDCGLLWVLLLPSSRSEVEELLRARVRDGGGDG